MRKQKEHGLLASILMIVGLGIVFFGLFIFALYLFRIKQWLAGTITLLISISPLLLGAVLMLGEQRIRKMEMRLNTLGLIHTLSRNWFWTHRKAAASALGRLGDPKAEQPLKDACQDRDADVSKAAAEALELLKAPAILIAFLLEGPAGETSSFGFQNSLILGASQADWKEKIREELHSPNAVVQIISPDEWHPDKIFSVSQKELAKAYPRLAYCLKSYITEKGLNINTAKLETGGTVILSPVSGKAFFVFKLERYQA